MQKPHPSPGICTIDNSKDPAPLRQVFCNFPHKMQLITLFHITLKSTATKLPPVGRWISAKDAQTPTYAQEGGVGLIIDIQE